MTKLTLKQKIGIGFGTLLAVVVLVGFVSYSTINNLQRISGDVDRIGQLNLLAKRFELVVETQDATTSRYVMTGDGKLLAAGDQAKADVKEVFGQLQVAAGSSEEKRLLVQLQQGTERLAQFESVAIDSRRSKNLKGAQDQLFNDTANQTRDSLRETLAEFTYFHERLRTEILQRQRDVQNRSRTLTVAFTLIGLAIGAFVAFSMGTSLVSSIARMFGLIDEIAENNLAVADLPVGANDELGRATRALNRMKNNLGDVMGSIALSSERLASASEEISASATQQAAGADMQRDRTGQVATAMQEMSSIVLDISGNSSKAAEAARKASETARRGGKIVEETLGKMRGIAQSVEDTGKKVNGLGTSSNQIGQIIDVIDDIADQTNLLALNAAIEAARAGDQGRGFAVVADEVRKLAERTSKATKEIAAMIQSVQLETKSAVEAMEAGTEQVEAGVETTQQAGNSLAEIIESAGQVGEMVTHIATAATEQSAATEEVNANLEQIAKITSETAEGAQQSAKACHDLSSLALDLQNLVSQFKLASNRNRPPARPTARENLRTAPRHSGSFSNKLGASGRTRPAKDEDDSDQTLEEMFTH